MDLLNSFITNPSYKLQWLNSPEQMAKQIKNIIIQSAQNPAIRHFAMGRVSDCEGNQTCIATDFFNFVKFRVQYQDDPSHYETIITPDRVLALLQKYPQVAGDCATKTALLGTLLTAMGIPVKVALVEVMKNGNETYNHVYIIANINGITTPMDATYPQNVMGWQLPLQAGMKIKEY